MSVELYIAIGQRVKSIRLNKLGITQEAMAKRLGITRPSLANIEGGKQKLTVDQLIGFSDILGVGPLELIPQFDGKGAERNLAASLPRHLDPKLRQWVEALQGKGQ